MATNMPVRAISLEEQLEQTGSVFLDRDQLWRFFDAEARNLVGLNGEEALARIQAGNAGSGLGWTELILLATLVHRH